jgi:hypothetical protein
VHFGDTEKLRELFRRFGSRQMTEDHGDLEFAINTKRGAVESKLAETELRKLPTQYTHVKDRSWCVAAARRKNALIRSEHRMPLVRVQDSSQRATADGLEHHSVPLLQATVHAARIA